jgi:hypothetical protein
MIRYVDAVRAAGGEACLCAAGSAVAGCADRRHRFRRGVPCRLTSRRHARPGIGFIGRSNISSKSDIEFLVEDQLAALDAAPPRDRLDWCEDNLADGHYGFQAQLTEEIVP